MNSMPQTKSEQDANYPWGSYVLRPLALRVVPDSPKLSANTVTWIGFGIGLLGCVGLGFGGYWYAIIGAALLNISLFVDHIDGVVARVTGTESLYGKWLDGFSGYTLEVLMPIAIGIGMMDYSIYYLILGVGYAFIRCFVRLLASYHTKVFGENIASWGNANWLYKTGMLSLSLELPLLLMSAITLSLDIFLAVFILANLGELGVIIWKSVRR